MRFQTERECVKADQTENQGENGEDKTAQTNASCHAHNPQVAFTSSGDGKKGVTGVSGTGSKAPDSTLRGIEGEMRTKCLQRGLKLSREWVKVRPQRMRLNK